MTSELAFRLSNDSEANAKKEFILKNEFSYISIKKISVMSLYGDVEWATKMLNIKPKIEIELHSNTGMTTRFYLDLISLTTPYLRQPVYETPNNNLYGKDEVMNIVYEKAVIKLTAEQPVNVVVIYEIHEREKFYELFQFMPSGSMIAREKTYINGTLIHAGELINKDQNIGGVNLNDYKDYDLATIKGEDSVIIEGFYNN